MRFKTRLLIYPIFASAIAALVGNLFGLCNAFAVDSSVDIKVNIEPVLSLSVTQPEAIAINANNINTLQTSSFTASAATNNITGYTLTMSSTTTDLVNNAVMVEGAYPVIPTLENNTTAANFPENHWGMSYDNGSNYVPFTLSSEIAHTMSPGNAIPINMKVGTKVNLNMGSGVYSNTVNFHLVANQSVFTITWNANGGTVSPSSKVYSYGMPLGELPVPTQEGYNFLGWFTAASGGVEVTPETVVAADATYFAQWEKKITLSSITNMQEMTPAICAASAEHETNQLKDIRDNKLYWVAKLKDGHCWMTQNLDLDLSSSKTLTPSDTNIASNWTPVSTATTVIKTNLSSSNWATSSDYTHPYSFDGGNAYLPNGLLSSPCTNKDITTCSGIGTVDLTSSSAVKDNENAHYHVGNLYTWTAAIAMNDSSSYSSSTASDYTKSPQTSICPKGWKLPNGAANGDFKALSDIYGSSTSNDNTLRAAPLWFVRSGNVDAGSLSSVGSYGYYWSSTVYYINYAHSMIVSDKFVRLTNTAKRSLGYAVRCIAQ